MSLALVAPKIDYAGMSILFALGGGACVVLGAGLFRGERVQRLIVPCLTLLTLAASLGLLVWQWGERESLLEGALRLDDLSLGLSVLFVVAAAAAVLLSLESPVVEQAGSGEYHALLLSTVAGMVSLAMASNLVIFFLALELLSIPLYVLCASRLRDRTSLESGLKYLIIGSVGSATLLYGLALVYGASSSTYFDAIGRAVARGEVRTDPLLLTGVALVVVGLAFKASIAPFHQWTPDVYQGAPTPVTAFMAVATKAAAFAVFLRFFLVALGSLQDIWGPALAALATTTIVVGNVGALGQDSLKRMLGYSGVAQAGYILIGLVVGTRLGLQAVVFYLAVYLLMNLGAFAVIVARERESDYGDDIRSLDGLGASQPLLAGAMTVCMLSLAGFPGTAGFVGKFYLVRAAVEGDYTWLAVILAIGTVISLGYYLRVIAVMWYRRAEAPAASGALPAIAGGSPEADAGGPPRVRRVGLAEGAAVAVALLCMAATIGFGIWPDPLLDAAQQAGQALFGAG